MQNENEIKEEGPRKLSRYDWNRGSLLQREQTNKNYLVALCVLVTQLRPNFCDPRDCSPPGSSIHGILQQEYWSGLPFPSPGKLPDPGIKPGPPAPQADAFISKPPEP